LVSLKNSSQTRRAEVSLLKLFKGGAANQYCQMCIYHAEREVTHGEPSKHTEIFQHFTVQSAEMEKMMGGKGRFQER
jgi:ribosomal protein L44E